MQKVKHPQSGTSGRAVSQAKAAVEAFRSVAADVFFKCRPADRSLAYFFRSNRKYGSRDRRFIMEIVYTAFRWWGGVKELLPAERRKEFENRFTSDFDVENGGGWPDRKAALKCLGAAVDFDQIDDSPALNALKALAGDFVGPAPSDCSVFPEWAQHHFNADVCPDRLADILQRRPPMWLRLQTDHEDDVLKKLQEEGLVPERHPLLSSAVSVGNPRVNLYNLDSFRAGYYDVQDLASQVIGEVCSPKPGERWWDACAGAGGKSLQLASLMKRKGTVVSSDIREYKLKDLKKRAKRAGFPNIQCRPWDGKRVPVKRANFDGVLVDAPCSCSGTWRRNPAARWQLPETDIRKMADVQLDIVSRAVSALRPGGILVFATCSMFREENNDNVERILHALPVQLEAFVHPLTGESVPGSLQVWPWDGNCDAMFAARFRKV